MGGIDYELREATKVDSEFVYQLRKEAFRSDVEATYGPWDEDWQRTRFAERFDPNASRIVVVNGRAVGELVVDWNQNPAVLSNIEIAFDSRGRGLGTTIVSDVLAIAARHGKGVTLQVFKTNQGSQRFYARLGFRSVDANETHCTMRWDERETQ
jgi:ribosomal protein S18 acetylase RimI-like enzyme